MLTYDDRMTYVNKLDSKIFANKEQPMKEEDSLKKDKDAKTADATEQE